MTLIDLARWLDELAVVCDANRAQLGDGTVADEYSKESRRFKAAAAGLRELEAFRSCDLAAVSRAVDDASDATDAALEAIK